MIRRALSMALALVALGAMATARADDDPRFAMGFVQGLRERGYYDLALDYLAGLRASKDTPPEIRSRLDYEEGRALVDAATHGSDPEIAKRQLDQARDRLDAFIKANPGKAETVEALVDLAHLLYERGRNAAIEADEAKTPAEKETRLVASRGFFDNARASYNQAYDRLDSKFKNYPNFLEEGDPLKAEKERVHASRMNAELQRAVVDYEEAQTYPAGSPQRNEILEKTGKTFEDIYKRYRTQMAGITAQMWQAKCFEERGDLNAAMGIYDALRQHADPRLRRLQKQVAYFQIIVLGKRKQYALAADEAAAWLRETNNDRGYEGLGVRLELAKDILAQLPEINPADKERALKRATDLLAEVVRVYSPFKSEALALLQKYAPKTAVSAASVANLKFDDAVAQADGAISTAEYDKAVAILRLALRKGAGSEPIEKLNKARYTLAFCEYMTKHYYEAAVLAEHIARRYPGAEWAAKATEIANASLVDAYNEPGPHGRPALWPGDLRRLEDLGKYAAATWPDSEQGDIGRMTAGQIALGNGRYAEAIELFGAVRSASPKWPDAQGFAGDAHWKQSLRLRDRDPASKEADAEVQKAIGSYQAAIKARKGAGAGEADLGLVGNVCDLATIDLEIGKPDESLKLVEPTIRALSLAGKSPTIAAALARALAIRLQGHVGVGQVDQALADMNALEQSGGAGTDRTQLYLKLGQLLEREIERLRKTNNPKALERTQEAYRKFLYALASSKSGQTYESLMWAGTNLLKLGAADEASGVFDQVLKVYSEDTQFLARPGASQRILLVKIKQVSALRQKGAIDEADAKLRQVLEQDRRLLEAQMEQGYLLAAKAGAKRGSWAAAIKYWENLAMRLGQMRPRPVEYFEAWYQAALALKAGGDATRARQALAGVMRLSPQVGDPTMKARYQELLGQLK